MTKFLYTWRSCDYLGRCFKRNDCSKLLFVYFTFLFYDSHLDDNISRVRLDRYMCEN